MSTEAIATQPTEITKKAGFFFWAISYLIAAALIIFLASFYYGPDGMETAIGSLIIIGSVLMLVYLHKRKSPYFKLAIGLVIAYVLLCAFMLKNNPTQYCSIFTVDAENYSLCMKRMTR